MDNISNRNFLGIIKEADGSANKGNNRISYQKCNGKYP